MDGFAPQQNGQGGGDGNANPPVATGGMDVNQMRTKGDLLVRKGEGLRAENPEKGQMLVHKGTLLLQAAAKGGVPSSMGTTGGAAANQQQPSPNESTSKGGAGLNNMMMGGPPQQQNPNQKGGLAALGGPPGGHSNFGNIKGGQQTGAGGASGPGGYGPAMGGAGNNPQNAAMMMHGNNKSGPYGAPPGGGVGGAMGGPGMMQKGGSSQSTPYHGPQQGGKNYSMDFVHHKGGGPTPGGQNYHAAHAHHQHHYNNNPQVGPSGGHQPGQITHHAGKNYYNNQLALKGGSFSGHEGSHSQSEHHHGSGQFFHHQGRRKVEKLNLRGSFPEPDLWTLLLANLDPEMPTVFLLNQVLKNCGTVKGFHREDDFCFVQYGAAVDAYICYLVLNDKELPFMTDDRASDLDDDLSSEDEDEQPVGGATTAFSTSAQPTTTGGRQPVPALKSATAKPKAKPLARNRKKKTTVESRTSNKDGGPGAVDAPVQTCYQLKVIYEEQTEKKVTAWKKSARVELSKRLLTANNTKLTEEELEFELEKSTADKQALVDSALNQYTEKVNQLKLSTAFLENQHALAHGGGGGGRKMLLNKEEALEKAKRKNAKEAATLLRKRRAALIDEIRVLEKRRRVQEVLTDCKDVEQELLDLKRPKPPYLEVVAEPTRWKTLLRFCAHEIPDDILMTIRFDKWELKASCVLSAKARPWLQERLCEEILGGRQNELCDYLMQQILENQVQLRYPDGTLKPKWTSVDSENNDTIIDDDDDEYNLKLNSTTNGYEFVELLRKTCIPHLQQATFVTVRLWRMLVFEFRRRGLDHCFMDFDTQELNRISELYFESVDQRANDYFAKLPRARAAENHGATEEELEAARTERWGEWLQWCEERFGDQKAKVAQEEFEHRLETGNLNLGYRHWE
ncbi:unnamed protein product [Amoebophrya sp. A120]|nr:unnamed protein product [Amoebophrya sp. A120]|eukprot:GSA120T00020705001.1